MIWDFSHPRGGAILGLAQNAIIEIKNLVRGRDSGVLIFRPYLRTLTIPFLAVSLVNRPEMLHSIPDLKLCFDSLLVS
jgi:hypothetical protein